MTFFYSFTETLLHSIWQAALLLCVYLFINSIERNYHPLQKRNFLYLLLLSQFCVSIVTFFSFFNSHIFIPAISFTTSFQNTYLLFLNNYYGLICTLYLSIVVIKILQIMKQWLVFKKNYSQQINRPTAALKNFTKYHANHLSINKKVTLWFSHAIKTPVTFGFFKPVILLPITLINNITTQQAELIILHELAHIKSKDYLLNWFLLIMETIYFFNPFIKIAAEKLKLEREKNCDIQVLNYQNNSIKYAETLYELAQNNILLKRFQLGVFKNNSQLFKRISFFSNDKNLTFKRPNYFFLLPLLFLLTGLISFLMVVKTSLPAKTSSQISFLHFKESFLKNKNFATSVKEIKTIVSRDNNYAEVIETKPSTVKILYKTTPVYPKIENPENIFIPVSLNETTDSIKEVIYNLETKNATITQSYKLIKKNGIWVFEPQWMVKVTNDSAYQKINNDSSLLFQLKEVQ